MKLFILITCFLTPFSIGAQSQQDSAYSPSGTQISIGISARENGDFEKSKSLLQGIHLGDTNYSLAQFELIHTYFIQEQFNECAERANKALSIYPDFAHKLYLILGKSYFQLNRKQEAYQAFTKGIEQFPSYSMLYYNRGLVYQDLDMHQEAVNDLILSVTYDPFHAPSHLKLGYYAKEQGAISQAMMCFNAYFILTEESDTEELAAYNSYLGESYDASPIDIQLSMDGYTEIDEMILSGATKSRKYKTPNKLSLPIIKQNYLLFTSLEKRAVSNGFWDNFYLPFFAQIIKDGKFNDCMYYLIRDANHRNVYSVLKKNQKAITSFPEYAGPLWKKSHSNHRVSVSNEWVSQHLFWDAAGNLEARGVLLEGEPMGDFEYFKKEGFLSAKGGFDENGERNGTWYYYFANGSVSAIEVYVDGDLEGVDSTFYANGVLKSTTPFERGQQTGIETQYYPSGAVQSKVSFEKGVQKGEVQSFYEVGGIQFQFGFLNDNISGDFIEYYANGQVAEKVQFVDGKRTGTGMEYHENGLKKGVFTYLNGDVEGQANMWYASGQLKSTGAYQNGNPILTQTHYYRNGKTSSIEIFDAEGKNPKSTQHFSKDGTLTQEYSYKKDQLMALKNYSDSGNVIYEAIKNGGAIAWKTYDLNKTLRSSGEYIPGEIGRDGKWVFYSKNGHMESETEYKNGMQTGPETHYFPNGTIEQSFEYASGRKNGTYQAFYASGQRFRKGMYINDLQEGLWVKYHSNGDTASTRFYVNGLTNGSHSAYTIEGKLSSINYYTNDRKTAIEVFDTNQMSLGIDTIHGDSSVYEVFNPFGQISKRITRKGNILHGPYHVYFSNHNLHTKGQYWNGNKHGKWATYYLNGTLKREGTYARGLKDGEWTYYHKNGKPSMKETYANGLRNGDQNWYQSNGILKNTLKYEWGELNGVSDYFGPGGHLQQQRKYAYNTLVAIGNPQKEISEVKWIPIQNESCNCQSFYENGNPSLSFTLVLGELNGMYTESYENGLVYKKVKYRNDQKEGSRFFYYPTGKIQLEETYLHDQLNGTKSYYSEDGTLTQTETYQMGVLHGLTSVYSKGQLIETYSYYDGIRITQ